MPSPEGFMDRLKELRLKFLEEALNPGAKDQTEFGYGKACGIAQGLEIAQRALSDQTAQEEDADGTNSKPTSGTTSRSRR